MFPLSAVADNRSKVVSQEECVTLARQFYGMNQKHLPYLLLSFTIFADHNQFSSLQFSHLQVKRKTLLRMAVQERPWLDAKAL